MKIVHFIQKLQPDWRNFAVEYFLADEYNRICAQIWNNLGNVNSIGYLPPREVLRLAGFPVKEHCYCLYVLREVGGCIKASMMGNLLQVFFTEGLENGNHQAFTNTEAYMERKVEVALSPITIKFVDECIAIDLRCSFKIKVTRVSKNRAIVTKPHSKTALVSSRVLEFRDNRKASRPRGEVSLLPRALFT